MKRMLLAELAVLVHLYTITGIFLILHRIVISLLAFSTGKHNFYSHITVLRSIHKVGSADSSSSMINSLKTPSTSR